MIRRNRLFRMGFCLGFAFSTHLGSVSASEDLSKGFLQIDSLAKAVKRSADAYRDAGFERVMEQDSAVAAFSDLVDTASDFADSISAYANRPGSVASRERGMYEYSRRLSRILGHLSLRENTTGLGADPKPNARDSNFVCCPTLPYDGTEYAPLRRFSAEAGKGRLILEDHRNMERLGKEIRADIAIERRFHLKNLEGFPAYPWEYMLNLTGNARRPARCQFIWLHPTLGMNFEDIWHEKNPSNPALFQGWHPSIQLELIGMNLYFFNKSFNYLGASAVFWSSLSRDTRGIGGTLHLANWATLGMGFATARNVKAPLFDPGSWEADWSFDPQVMVGWTASTKRLFDAVNPKK